MPPLRRLPVLQESAAPDDGRPAWHWGLIGALFALSIWVPLAMLSQWMAGKAVGGAVGEVTAEALAGHLESAGPGTRAVLWVAVTVVPILCFAVSCAGASILVGRFGNRAGPREAAWGGSVAAAVGALITVPQAGVASALAGLLVLLPVGTGASWLGGRFGYRLRPLAERRR